MITCLNLRTTPITHLFFWRLLEGISTVREENAKKSSEEKSSNSNEQLPCKWNEIMTEAYNDCKKGDLNNSLLKTGDSTNQDDVPISGSRRNSFAEETTMKSKQRESSINLGIFTS